MGSQMDIIACWVAEGASARAVTRSTRCARRPRLRWPAAAAAAAEATAAEEAPAAEEAATATASPVRLLVRAEKTAEEEATATASPVRLAWTEEAGLLVDEEHDVGCVSASARGSLGRVGRHLHRSTAACPVRLLDLQQQTCLLHRLAATFAPPPMPPPPAPPHGPPPHMPDWETCPHQKLC